MKKIWTFLFSCTACVCAYGMTAFAAAESASSSETITDLKNDNSAEIGVTGTVDKAASEEIIYSVDITWGSMEFVFTEEKEGTWNPQTHSYVGHEDAGWSCEDGSNEITVTNHSNASVNVDFTFTSNSTYSIDGSFDIADTTTLSKGSVGQYDAADSVTAALTLSDDTPLVISSGSQSSSENGSFVIGTVTVTISEVSSTN